MAGRENGQLPEHRYLDRELAWLDFNNWVLDLARDAKRVPLLERVEFLAVSSNNLDEFFMMRVAGLKRRIQAGVAVTTITDARSNELHASILEHTAELIAEQSCLFQQEIHPQLCVEGIEVPTWNELTTAEGNRIHTLFGERIFPVLTPLTVGSSRSFPYIPGLSVNLAVLLRSPATGASQFTRVKVPTNLSRFVKFAKRRFMPLEKIILRHLGQLFAGMEVLYHATFRVTRNEDIEMEEDDAENLLYTLEKELLRRKVGRPPMCLKVEDDIDETMPAAIISELGVAPGGVFRLPAPFDLTGLFALEDSRREDLKYPGFLPITHPDLTEVESSSPTDMFKALKCHGVLMQHPYDSFATSVQRFIKQVAAGPAMLAIKQTLYRTSGDSPTVDALIETTRARKQVLAVVGIKARFDEQNSISWARQLEQARAHVVYGMVGLKTHYKLSLVIREEFDRLCRYAHIGTGNYHPKTVCNYEDMGLLTVNPIIINDAARLLNHLSGITHQAEYRRPLVAPHGIRSGLLERIETEITNRVTGLPSGIHIKVNSIADEAVIDAPYRASRAGVEVNVWVWGICTIRPGVKGLSENIWVRSILGRFLEHPHIYWLEAGRKPSVGVESADLMHRSLDRRVEAIVGLSNPGHIARIRNLFEYAFDNRTVHWELQDRTWSARTTDPEGRPLSDLQEELIRLTRGKRHR